MMLVAMISCRYLKNEKTYYTEHNDTEGEQESTNYQIRDALLLWFGTRDAEGPNEKLSKICQQLHGFLVSTCFRIKVISFVAKSFL